MTSSASEAISSASIKSLADFRFRNQNQIYAYRLDIFANAGRHDEALDLLERRVGMGGLYRQWVERDPDFAGLRDHPRFQALLDRMSSPRVGEGMAGPEGETGSE